MKIDKDTLIFGSFAKEAGNTGCIFFNEGFSHYGLNAIYKSFSVDNIRDAIKAARILKFKGFAVTMPFKKDVIYCVDKLDDKVVRIDAANTVINEEGILTAYNTDYLAAKEFLEKHKEMHLFILGDGGYAAAVRYAAKTLNMKFNIINRKNWNEIKSIKDSLVYNCTPVSDIKVDLSNVFIDCLITSETGKKLSKIQASYQFELYTGLKYPL